MCNRRHPFRVGRLLLATSGLVLALTLPPGGAATAQSVQVFDDAPPIELLRSIMIPESQPGLSRTIVMQKPDTTAPASGVQRVAAGGTHAMPSPVDHTPAAADSPDDAASARMADSSAASQVRPALHKAASSTAASSAGTPAVKPGTVGLRINFAFNSAELPTAAFAMIDRVVTVMKEAPDIKVRVEGHTDAAGAPGYNLSLSERRALSVAQYLVKQGIEPSRLSLVGKGMTEPLTQNPYDPDNRRVQFVRVS